MTGEKALKPEDGEPEENPWNWRDAFMDAIMPVAIVTLVACCWSLIAGNEAAIMAPVGLGVFLTFLGEV